MEKPNKELTIPILWNGWDQVDTSILTFYDVTFTSDFGVFKQNENYSSIIVDTKNGIVQGYDSEGIEILKTQEFIFHPINQKI
jgi:hypothetical protein